MELVCSRVVLEKQETLDHQFYMRDRCSEEGTAIPLLNGPLCQRFQYNSVLYCTASWEVLCVDGAGILIILFITNEHSRELFLQAFLYHIENDG